MAPPIHTAPTAAFISGVPVSVSGQLIPVASGGTIPVSVVSGTVLVSGQVQVMSGGVIPVSLVSPRDICSGIGNYGCSIGHIS